MLKEHDLDSVRRAWITITMLLLIFPWLRWWLDKAVYLILNIFIPCIFLLFAFQLPNGTLLLADSVNTFHLDGLYIYRTKRLTTAKHMLVIISPSKTLEFGPPGSTSEMTQPIFIKEAAHLIGYLKKLSVSQLEEVMKISTKLALLTQERIALWKPEFTNVSASQAIFSFKGEVYHGLDVRSMEIGEVESSQHHLRILSGLYGVLRPLDLIRPYRLEMGTSLQFGKYDNLYQFWRHKITKQISIDLKESGSALLINLASQEYFSAIDIKKYKVQIVTPQFLEEKNGSFSMITVYAKKARGMMARYILQNHIDSEEDLRGFDSDGYYFNSYLSKPGSPVFTR